MGENQKEDPDDAYAILGKLVKKSPAFANYVKRKVSSTRPVIRKIPLAVEPLPDAIASITTEQKISLAKYRDEWFDVATSTATTANRLAIQKALRNVYVRAKKSKKRIANLWFDSPMAGVEEVLRRTGNGERQPRRYSKVLPLYKQELEHAETISMQHLSRELHQQLTTYFTSSKLSVCAKNVATVVACEISNRFAACEFLQNANMSNTLQNAAETTIADACFGPQEAAFLGFHEYLLKEIGVEQLKFIGGMIATARCCGWFWTLNDAIVMTQRPRKLFLDENAELHSATGQAIEYRDGFGACAWHGVRVPETAILDPDSVPWLLVLDEKDQSLKNALAEIKAHKWAGNEDSDEYRAAKSAIRLGGVPALMDLIK